MNSWLAYDDGRSIGKVGAEGGVILLDDEHGTNARITLKRGSGYISVSCNLYGWIDHTRFFGTLSEAQREYGLMKSAMEAMIKNILEVGASDLKMWEAIAEFVRRFP
jgi:hypothetical protein